MFGLGMGELVVILIVALIFLGPNKLPEAAKAIGKGIRELRRHTNDFQQTIEQDEELGGTVKEIKSALRGEPPPLPRVAPAKPEPKPAAPGAPASPPPLPKADGDESSTGTTGEGPKDS
jgi:sec-independent protein translocase protein TatB